MQTPNDNQPQLPMTGEAKKLVEKIGRIFLILFVVVLIFYVATRNSEGGDGEEFIGKIQSFNVEYSEKVKQEQQAKIDRCVKESEGAKIKILSNATYPERFEYSPEQITELMMKRDKDCTKSENL